MNRITLSLLTFICVPITSSFGADSALSLSADYWNDQNFLKSFNSSYKINAHIEPTVNAEQRAVLVSIQGLMAKEQYKVAATKIEESPLTSKSAILLYNLANIYFELSEFENAEKYYLAALQHYPSFRRAHKNLGMIRMRLDKPKEAMASLVEALQLGDMSGSTLGMLGYCHIDQGNFASALQSYRMAQLTEPNVLEWKAGVAQCLLEMGNLEEALLLLEEIYKARPQEDSYALLLVRALLDAGKATKGMALLELMQKQARLNSSNQCLLAYLYASNGDLQLAKKHFEKLALLIEPSNIAHYLKAVESVMHVNDYRYAIDCLKSVAGVKPLSVEDEASYNKLLAYCYIQEDMPEARELLTEMLEKSPLNGDAILLMARLHMNDEEYEKVEMLFERAQKIPAFKYKAFLAHGQFLVNQKRYRKALEKYQKADAIKTTPQQRQYIEELERIAGS